MKELFLLNPNIIFLNHGSFGATPRRVMDAYQAWQNRLEKQPVQFITRELLGELANARHILGDFINASADDLVFIPNATFGVNIIARSLKLQVGDQILASNHEYGACENIWTFVTQKTGAEYVKQPVSLPFRSAIETADQFWEGVTAKTKVIFLSHITSPTAQLMPIDIICSRARQAGILTVIDGAHAPGQIPLDLEKISADFYTGNCHKWMLSPKGAAFLYARTALQYLIEPLVISWGWGENSPYTTESRYLDMLEWWGTNDPSAYLSVPAAIQFMADHDWESVRNQCNRILRGALGAITKITGLSAPYSENPQSFSQMAIAPLPPIRNISELKDQLYDQFGIEVPVIEWGGRHFIRISIQGYNTASDINALKDALVDLLPQHKLTG